MFRILAFKSAILGAIILVWAAMASMNYAAAEYFPDSHGQWSTHVPVACDRIG